MSDNKDLINALMGGPGTEQFIENMKSESVAEVSEETSAIGETLAAEPVKPEAAVETGVKIEPNSASPDYSFLNDIIQTDEKTPDKIREAILSERKSYQEKIEALSKAPVSKFHNDNIRMFNDFVKETGRENYSLFHKMQNTTVSPDDSVENLVDAIVLKEVFDDASKESVKDALRSKLISDYTVELDEDSTANERALAQLKQHELFTKANEAVNKFGEIIGKIKGNEPKIADADALILEKNKRLEKWEPLVKENVDRLKIQVPKYENKNGEIKYLDESLIDVNFDDKDKAEYANLFRALVAANDAPEPTKEMLDQAHSFAYKETVFKKIPELVADAYAKGLAEKTKETIQEADNPSALKAEQKQSGGGDSLSDIGKAIVSQMM